MNVSASVPMSTATDLFQPRGCRRRVPKVAAAACPPAIPGVPDLDDLLVLVRKIASWFERRWGLPAGWDHDDLVHEGVVGLMKSLKRFDPVRGACAETFCGYGVRGSLFRRAGERWDQVNHEAPPPDAEPQGPWPSPETYCLYRETRDAILDELSLSEQVLVFGAADDEPLSSMARELGLSTSAAFRWHRRALKKVRAAVGTRHDDVPPAG